MKNNKIQIADELLILDNKVGKQDVENIRQLISQLEIFSEEEIKISGELVEDALSGKDDSYHFLFLRDTKGRIVAYSCFGEICLTNKRYDLYWIGVAKEFQKQKLATLILEKTEIVIKELGGKKIYAETSSLPTYQAARSFYLKSEFVKVAEILDFYKDGDAKVIFCKDL